MSDSICLATNYLLMTESTRRMWLGLHEALEHCGMHLVLLSTTVPEPPFPFPVIPIPYLLRDFATSFPGAAREVGQFAPEDFTLLAGDSMRAHPPYPPGEGLAGLVVARRVIRLLVQCLEPSYVLTWDSTSPFAALTTQLCGQLGIPMQALERGLLAETLMIESRGIQAASDLRTHWLAREMPAEVPGLFDRVRDYYREQRPQKYHQAGAVNSAAELGRQLELKGEKVVLFFGQFDPCGLVPQSPQRNYNSPAFASTKDALKGLWEEVSKLPNTALVFKPHPLDRDPYAVAKIDGVRVIEKADVHVLIEMADVVAAQFTTLQFEAALYGKPVLLLGRSAWWGRQATYEVNRRAELGGLLRASLERVGWPLRESRARQFISWLMNDFLIRCSAEVPARREFSDLARFLADTALVPEQQSAFKRRIDFTLHSMAQLRAAAQAPDPLLAMPREVLRQRAAELFAQARWGEAGQHFTILAKRWPDDLAAWRGSCECARRQGHQVFANILAQDGLKLHPEWAACLTEPPAASPLYVTERVKVRTPVEEKHVEGRPNGF